MPRKKESDVSLSETEQAQIQQQLERYRELVITLRETTNHTQAESALSEINALPESAQLALIRDLTKEQTIDAADLLAALNAFSPYKEARKEARRALIRLETFKMTPRWSPPIDTTPAIQMNISNPPRFWKGFVTQMRDQGEVELFLMFEQGYDYTDVHSFVFLLDFWKEGVKSALVDVSSKRTANENIARMRANLSDVAIVECSVAEAKRLLEEALSVNAWRKTPPHEEYRKHQADINKLILQSPDPGVDHGQSFINPDLSDQEVPIFFIGGWTMGDYGLTYDLLSQGSSLRAGTTRDEWIERHRAWADEAHPVRLELGFVHEREQTQSALWVPSGSAASRSTSRKVIEVGWSVELTDTPLNGTLKEMPMGTAINKDTGRHWFWTSYTLVRENDAWRIQHFTDEGATVQGLPIPELQRRLKESEDAINGLMQKQPEDVNATMEELGWRVTQLLHYDDAMIARLPFDREACERATDHAISVASPERTMVYLERLATRFPERHAEVLRQLGATTAMAAANYDTSALRERYRQLMRRAEGFLRDAIEAENSAISHLLLSELLLGEMRNDEAEAEALRALERRPSPSEEASVEAILGTIAMRREQPAQAIPHFERTVELDPDRAGSWFSLGFAHRILGHEEQAEEYYSEAIQKTPNDIRPYTELIALYMNQERKLQARAVAEQGVQAVPESEVMHALFASVLYELGETREARRELEIAESINPNSDIVVSAREQMKKHR